MAPILVRVMRLLILMLCVLGLALAPMTANAAAEQMSGRPGCAMDGKMPSKSADHSKRDCCTPACQVASSAALLPGQTAAATVEPVTKTGQFWAPATELASAASSGLDPPPRA